MNSVRSLCLEQQQVCPKRCAGIEFLGVPVEWMRYCTICDGDRLFMADRRCSSGLIARCANCGDERIAVFTRTNSAAIAWEAYT